MIKQNLINKILNEKENNYEINIQTIDEKDKEILDKSRTTGMIQFGVKEMEYPKFWRNQKFQLPFRYFKTELYKNVNIETINDSLPYYGEGNRIKISEEKTNNKINKILSAVNYGGSCWQHIIQDILPIIVFNHNILKNDPEINVLVYEYRQNQKIYDFIFNRLSLKNKLISVPYLSKSIINVEEFYNLECNIDIPTQWWPLFFYEEINAKLNENIDFKNKNVIYNKRNFSRKFLNENEVINCLREYANNENLQFILFESEKYSLPETQEIFRNAHTIIAPHGGANYNIIFSNSKTKFVEYVFTDTMYTLCNLAGGIGLNYYLVPNSGNNHTHGINVNIDKLKNILSK